MIRLAKKIKALGHSDRFIRDLCLSKKEGFISFEDARRHVRDVKLKNYKEWVKYRKEARPPYIPSHPERVYKDEWVSYADWLGSTGQRAQSYGTKFKTFEEARKFARQLNLKTVEWRSYWKNNRPQGIPVHPERVYKENWVNWADWLRGGLTSKGPYRRFRPFKEALEFVVLLKIKNEKEWRLYCKSGEKPLDIPSNPRGTYKKDYISLGHWLGKDTGKLVFSPFKDAREYVKKLNIKSQSEWRLFCKYGKKPIDIPSHPDRVYRGHWVNWLDWLNTTLRPQYKAYRPFKDAREYVKKLNIKSRPEWDLFCKSGKRPSDIPYHPGEVHAYKKDWVSWQHWLGVEKLWCHRFLPFEEAKKYVKNLGLKSCREWGFYCKSGRRPKNIPWHPDKSYKENWVNWADWLGKPL